MVNKDDDMSNTFIAEVGQKSAIAKEEVETLNDVDEVVPSEDVIGESKEVEGVGEFPEVKIDPPTNNEPVKISDTPVVPKDEVIPGYESESNNYDDEPKRKKGNPLITIILMILSLAIGVGGSYYYFEVLNKEDTPTKIEEKEEETTTEELKPDGVFVKNLIEDYDFSGINNTNLYNILYSQEKLEVKSLNENYMRILVAIKANRNLDVSGFSGEDFQSAVTKLFGPNITLENKDFSDDGSANGACYAYSYNQETGYYEFKEPNGCGGTSVSSLERKIVKAVKKEDTLEVNVAIAILNGETKKVYKNMMINTDGTDASEEIEGVTVDTFDIDKDYSKLNQYKYTFKYDSENNNYYLETIELEK